MIRHLRHDAIDKARWDDLLQACTNRLWYAQSWVLDRTCPGWEALIDEASGAVMPLPWRRKWGVDYLFQPLGLQRLGVFASNDEPGRIDRFLTAVPRRFTYWDIMLNGTDRPEPALALRLEERLNMVLPLLGGIDTLRSAYATGHRRNLRKTGPETRISTMSSAAFMDLYRSTTAARFGERGPLTGLEALIEEGKHRGQCAIVALRRGEETLGAACFATWEGRTILLKSANTAAGREARGLFHIVDHWIERHAGSGLVLDFAGSMVPEVARFYTGFGAVPTGYLRVVMNRLPWPLRWLKR